MAVRVPRDLAVRRLVQTLEVSLVAWLVLGFGVTLIG